MERKLVTVAKVLAKHPIEGADLIERIQVKGWNLVSGKGNFEVGDLCAYFEIDSFLPEEPEFEFLRKGFFRTISDGSTGFQIKTIKLKGQVSQGLALPLLELHRFFPTGWFPEEGVEITEFLGVKKWEAPVPAELDGFAKGMKPSSIHKTDEERVQNLQEMLDDIQGTIGYKTLKIDGDSMTAYLIDEDFGVCTRTVDVLKNSDNYMWKVAIALDLENKLSKISTVLAANYMHNIAIQGEIYGEGIQGNKLKIKGQQFAAFNIFNIDTQTFLDFDEFESVCKEYSIPTVPIIDSNYVIHNDIEKYVEESKVQYPNGSKAEGIVIRPKVEMNWRGNRVSFKIINPEFLLKYGE